MIDVFDGRSFQQFNCNKNKTERVEQTVCLQKLILKKTEKDKNMKLDISCKMWAVVVDWQFYICVLSS